MYPPISFDSKDYINLASKLCCVDEPLLALELLERFLPAFYREAPPQEITDLRNEIMSRMATSCFYSQDAGFELTVQDEDCYKMTGTLRVILCVQDVKALNEKGHIPHVIDFGGGENFLPLALDREGGKFTYESAFVNWPTYHHTKHRFEKFEATRKPEQPTIFFMGEVLEHIYDLREGRFEMQKRCGKADIIILSTPKNTVNPYVTNFRDIGTMGHLRCFTFHEFEETIKKIYNDYSWAFYDSQILGARLINPQSKFDCIKTHYEIKE